MIAANPTLNIADLPTHPETRDDAPRGPRLRSPHASR